jgi:type II secretory pathway pseudopilin PulG
VTVRRRGRARRRVAFTMLEVLIMAGIALILLAVSWSVFFAMTNQSRKLDNRLRALQASQIVIERIKTDLKQFYFVPGVSMVEASPPRLSFYVYRDYVYSPTERSQRSVALEPVTYIFDREVHLLRKNTEFIRAAPLEDLQFALRESTGGPAPEYSNSVIIRGVHVSEDLLSTPDRITARDRISWTTVIGLPHRTLAEAYSFWLENPFDRPAN